MQRAIDDSYLLLAFLSRAHLTIESDTERKQFDEYTRAISIAQIAVSKGENLQEPARGDFWRAFIFLSNVGSPATIESIRYYFAFYDRDIGTSVRSPTQIALPGPPGSAAPRRKKGRTSYTRLTTIVLVVTLLLSLVGFVGGRTLEKFAADSRHWYALVDIARLTALGQTMVAVFDHDGKTLLVGTETNALPTPEVGPRVGTTPQTPATVAPGNGPPRSALFKRVVEIPEGRVLRLRAALPGLLDADGPKLNEEVWVPACKDERTCVKARHVLLAEEFVFTLAGLQTEHAILSSLLRPITFIYEYFNPEELPPFTPPRFPEKCRVKTPFENTGGAPRRLPAEAELRSAILSPIVQTEIFLFILCNETPMPINLPPPLHNMLTMDYKADLFLSVLNNYILALMFGLLGACVHVTRDINRRIDDFTLTGSMLNRYWARLILGGVSGAFIGLFFNSAGELGMVSGPNAPAGTLTSHLTGVTLAFVAGFSVEVLFAILDRTTQVFRDFAHGSPDTRQTGSPGAVVRTVRVQ